METGAEPTGRRVQRKAESTEGWYYRIREGGHDLVKGPYSETEIRAFCSRGRMPAHALIRHGLKGTWQPVSAFFSSSRKEEKRVSWRHVLLPLLFAVLLVVAVTRDNPGVLEALQSPSWKGAAAKESPPLVLEPFLSPGMGSSLPLPEPTEPVLTRQRIILWTNEARAQQMLLLLAENRQLDAIAAERVNDMFHRQYFAHVSPSGDGVADAARRIGYRYKILSENIAKGAFGDAQRVIQGWLKSQGHRQNMLSRDVEEIGAAVGKGRLNGEIVWVAVQVFGKPVHPGQGKILPGHVTGTLPSPPGRPGGFLRARIDTLNAEIQAAKSRLSALKSDIETQRIALLSRVRKEQEIDNRLTKEYRTRVRDYNLLVEEIRRKDQLARDLIAQYNSDDETPQGLKRN